MYARNRQLSAAGSLPAGFGRAGLGGASFAYLHGFVNSGTQAVQIALDNIPWQLNVADSVVYVCKPI